MSTGPVERPTWWACYLAAYIDADGTIGYFEHHRPGRSRPTQTVMLTVHSTDLSTVEILHRWSEVGHLMHDRGHARRAPNRRELYRWSVQGRQQLLRLLPEIIPFMHLKKSRAEAALSFLRGETSYEEASDLLRESNRRGTAAHA